MPMLNLTDHQEMSNDAVPRGRYYAEVVDLDERETKEAKKLPKGTPMIFAHFKVLGKVGEDAGENEDSPYYNRRVFTNFIIPPDDYDPKSAKFMRGRLVSFFKAVGVPDEEMLSGEWEPDVEDYIEEKLVIDVKVRKDDPTQNDVAGFRNYDEVLEKEGDVSASGLI